jgi:hypothetical protein
MSSSAKPSNSARLRRPSIAQLRRSMENWRRSPHCPQPKAKARLARAAVELEGAARSIDQSARRCRVWRLISGSVKRLQSRLIGSVICRPRLHTIVITAHIVHNVMICQCSLEKRGAGCKRQGARLYTANPIFLSCAFNAMRDLSSAAVSTIGA